MMTPTLRPQEGNRVPPDAAPWTTMPNGLYLVYRRTRFPDWRSRLYRWLSNHLCGSDEFGHVGMLVVCSGRYLWMDTNYDEVSCIYIESPPEDSRMVYLGTEITGVAIALHIVASREGWKCGNVAALTSALKPGCLKHLGYWVSHATVQFPCTHLPSLLLGLWLFRDNVGVIQFGYMVGMSLEECFGYLEYYVPPEVDLYQFALDQWKPVDFLAQRV